MTEQLYSHFQERYDQIEPVIQSLPREFPVSEGHTSYPIRRLLVTRMPVWASGIAVCALVAFVCLYAFNPFKDSPSIIPINDTTSGTVAYDPFTTTTTTNFTPSTPEPYPYEITAPVIHPTRIPTPTLYPNNGTPAIKRAIYPIYNYNFFLPPTTTIQTTVTEATTAVTTTKVTTTATAVTTAPAVTTVPANIVSMETGALTTNLSAEYSSTKMNSTTPSKAPTTQPAGTTYYYPTTATQKTSSTTTTKTSSSVTVPSGENGKTQFVQTSLSSACQLLGIPSKSEVPTLNGTNVQVYVGYFQGYPFVLRVEYTDTATKTVTGLIEISKIPYTATTGTYKTYSDSSFGRIFQYDNTGSFSTYASFTKVYSPYQSLQSMIKMAEQWAKSK